MSTKGSKARPHLSPTLPPPQGYTVYFPGPSVTWPSLIPVRVGEQYGAD